MQELRCGSKKHGELDEEGHLEVKCSSSFCGAGPGTVVLHKFDIETGRLVDTKRYREIQEK